jgi:hypothetical protein
MDCRTDRAPEQKLLGDARNRIVATILGSAAALPRPATVRKGNAARERPQFVTGGATAASGWLLRLSASATKPETFISSTKPRR